jgi:hypothetical protein
VIFSFLFLVAAPRMRACAHDTASRLCVRTVLCSSAFLLVPSSPSTNSAADRSALFASFAGTIDESDFFAPFSGKIGGVADDACTLYSVPVSRRTPKTFTTVDLEMKEAPALLVEFGFDSHPAIAALRLLRARYTAGKARRRRRRCRHVRLPIVDRDGFTNPAILAVRAFMPHLRHLL